MGVVKWQDHSMVSPVSNWSAFFLFHINQITIPYMQLFWNLILTRSTRMPAFWGYPPPPPPHDYPLYWVILDPKSKEDKVKVTNFKICQNQILGEIFKQTLHATHLLELLDKMCKYEMDPMSIVEDTDYRADTILSTDGQTDKVKPLYPPFNFVEAEGITNLRDLIAATGLVILLNLDSNRRFFSPCDLEIWWMTPKNNMAPLLCYFKLCASFRSHWRIQTGVTVWKCLIWFKIDDFFSHMTLQFDGWPWKTIGHIFHATSSFVHHFIAISEF